jgi:hypothetical protein
MIFEMIFMRAFPAHMNVPSLHDSLLWIDI